ncbi:MAG: RidA family protein [Steroidobacteraceae bacterium]|nr:RidA family protein [Steroidobacteraceae bacterium]
MELKNFLKFSGAMPSRERMTLADGRFRQRRRFVLPALLSTVCLLGATACTDPPAPPPPRIPERLQLNAFEAPFGYSQAVKVDRTVYVSNTMPVDRQGRLVAPGDMGAQLEAVYANLALTLEPHGAGYEHVVMERIYVTDMDAFLAVSDSRFKYHARGRLPATTIVEVRRLIDPGFLIAIDAVVELPSVEPGAPGTR